MMLTRCPACTTAFRITPEQLKARHGKVRCGQCQHIFDALETLLDAAPESATEPLIREPVAAAAETEWPPTEPLNLSPEVEPTTRPTAATAIEESMVVMAIDEPTEPSEPDHPPVGSAEASADAADARQEALEALQELAELATEKPAALAPELRAGSSESDMPKPAEPAELLESADSAESAELIDAQESPENPPPASAAAESAPTTRRIEPLLHDGLAMDADEEPSGRSWLWAFAVLLAVLALLLQAVVQFRVELAVLSPEIKPALQSLCDVAGCDLPLPRKADQLSIESSDLHPDPQNKGQLMLTATLKNRAPFAQIYPHLELTLTDTLDQPLLRKILTPTDYLPKGVDNATGFVANGEVAVNLSLIPENATKVAAAGYRLYLFYP